MNREREWPARVLKSAWEAGFGATWESSIFSGEWSRPPKSGTSMYFTFGLVSTALSSRSGVVKKPEYGLWRGEVPNPPSSLGMCGEDRQSRGNGSCGGIQENHWHVVRKKVNREES